MTISHPDRFIFLSVTDSWSKIPKTSNIELHKQLLREEMNIYKKKQFALNYCPNFEFGRKQLSSSFGQRKLVMTKILPYNHEVYLEFNVYSKNPQRQLFRNPTVPNFIKLLERELDGISLIPSFMQKYTNTCMGIDYLDYKMLELNNFRDGNCHNQFYAIKNKKNITFMSPVKKLNNLMMCNEIIFINIYQSSIIVLQQKENLYCLFGF